MPTVAPAAAAAAPAAPAPKPPSMQAYDRYSDAIFRIPGVDGIGASIADPDHLPVTSTNPEFARLGQNVLRDSVDGVGILAIVNDPEPGEPPRTEPVPGRWYDRSTNAMRAILAMPGVTDYMVDRESPHKDYIFWTQTADQAAKYTALVKPQLGTHDVRFMKQF